MDIRHFFAILYIISNTVNIFFRSCVSVNSFRNECRLIIVLLGTLVVCIGLLLSYLIKQRESRHKIQLKLLQFYCSVWVMSWTGVIRYHGPRPQKRPNQVFVANHTTVFDIVVLQQNFCFSIVGQKHPGIMGSKETDKTFVFLKHFRFQKTIKAFFRIMFWIR